MKIQGQSRWIASGMLLVAILFTYGDSAQAQLRIVTYNTANGSFSGNNIFPRTGMDVVLEAIGDELVGGIAKPIDALILQEQADPSTSTQAFVDLLNGIYGDGTYARSTVFTGPAFDALHQSLVYNTQTLSLIGETAFGQTGTGKAARQTGRFQLRPVGYSASADLYIYNDHYKASTGATNEARRNFEAQTVRADADALGQGTYVIYAGDYNIRSSSEAMYQTLLSSGNGQAFDPINSPGIWHNSSSLRFTHTQSPASSQQYGGQVTGGMDDRFDFQLVTGELLDNEGLSYIPGSYRVFGNNGTHACCNSPITSGNGASPTVLNALMSVSDHLPVVADYQLPAIMDAQLASIPSFVSQGTLVNVDVMIENIANVLTSNGADELDYILSVSGDLFGNASGTDFALGNGNIHQVTLDTSTMGLRSGSITVTSNSQAVGNGFFSFPVSFTVGSFLEADFNADGNVDGADLAQWQGDMGLNENSDADGDSDSDGTDFLVWQQQFGSGSNSAPLSQTVPEPTSALLLGIAFVLITWSHDRASEYPGRGKRGSFSWPKRFLACSAVLILPTVALAGPYDPPAGYYNSATGTGATLKSQLTSVMSTGQIQRSYGDFRFSAAVTDADPDIPGNILLVYNRASVSGVWNLGGQLPWNREHVWPQSRQPGSANNGTMGNLGDPHALRPADTNINSNRANKPFGFETTAGSHRSIGSYYFPGDADKGDIARQLFYSDTRYTSSGLSLSDSFPSGNQMGDRSSLIAWHYLDPPDEFERRRNQAIYSAALNPTYYTNNRNAYIDRPEYVWSVYVDQQNDSWLYVGNEPAVDGSSTLEVDLGSVLVGANVPSAQNVTLRKSGFDGTYYEVSPSGDATSSVTGRYQAFAINNTGSDSRTLAVGLNTDTFSAGPRSGSVTIDNLDITTGAGTGQGENDGNDLLNVTLDVLDHANASFNDVTDLNTLLFDFGSVDQGNAAPSWDFNLFNLESTTGFTAAMELDSILSTGDTSTLTTDLTPLMGAAALDAGTSNPFTALFDTSVVGEFSASYTLRFSDENLPGASQLTDLLLTLTGTVENAVVEPADFDADTDIDGADFLVWQRGFGISSGAQPDQGDANQDNQVNDADLTVWQQQFGTTDPPSTVAVPEPSSLNLLAPLLLGLLLNRNPPHWIRFLDSL